MNRLLAEGLTPMEAAERLLKPETAAEYVMRNEAALAAVEARILSPEYMERFATIQQEKDPVKRAQLSADFKRENFATMDLAALHRTISARNRQMKAEGILPPDAPV